MESSLVSLFSGISILFDAKVVVAEELFNS